MAAAVFNFLSLIRQVSKDFGFIIKTLTGRKALRIHSKVSKGDIGNRPILVVGDIHGCFDEIIELLAKTKEVTNGAEPYLVCVGDMLNKGPKNLEVVRFLKDLVRRNVAAAVMGNHEEAILKQYNAWHQDKDYVLPERYKYLVEFDEDDFAFLSDLPYSLTIPHLNAIVVHAGLVPGIPLHKQRIHDIAHMRNVVTTVSIPWGVVTYGISKPTEGVAWAQTWQGPQHVYFGHDCRRGLQQLPLATGLDTGCVYGKNLTGVLLTGADGQYCQLISVQAKRQYYLGKPGKAERKNIDGNDDSSL